VRAEINMLGKGELIFWAHFILYVELARQDVNCKMREEFDFKVR